MKNLERIILYINSALAIIVILLSSSTAIASMISVQPTVSNQVVDDFFDVSVNINDITDLYAFQFDIGFDPTVLQAVGLTEGPFLANGGATFFFPGTIDNAAGTISFTADSLLGPDPGVTGSGNLVTLSFQAVGQGTSTISLSNLVFLDSSLSDILLASEEGSVNVSKSTVPEPTTIFLLGLGLIGIVGAKKRMGI